MANPLAKGRRPFFPEILIVHLEHVGPFVRHVLDISRTADEPVDQLVALHFHVARVGEKHAHVTGRRRQAGQIEINAADEFGVGAKAAWQRLHELLLGIDELVDIVVRRLVLPNEAAAVPHHGDSGRGVIAFEAHQHGGLAAPQGRNQPMLVGFENLDVAAFDEGLGRNVAHAAVGISRQHAKLLLHFRQWDDWAGRLNLDLRHPRGRAIERRPLRDPALEQLVGWLARLHEHSADVRHRGTRLEQHQALLGHRSIEPPGREIVGER